jgi:putative Holliday junction resolvase
VTILALDYGAVRTGVAVSDPSGTLARPLEVVEQASRPPGLARIAELVREHEAERIVVGLPVTLSGQLGMQAAETERFIAQLKTVVSVPVVTYDERFTSTLAGPGPDSDARAAAHLLNGYLEWSRARR